MIDKQEKELQLWYEDIEAAIGVGRVIHALKLSSQPPKAGIRFPDRARSPARRRGHGVAHARCAERTLVRAAGGGGVLAGAALIVPTARPEQPSDDLTATVRGVAPLLPQIAGLFGIEVAPGAASPKPLRPTRPLRRRRRPARRLRRQRRRRNLPPAAAPLPPNRR